MQQHIDFMLSRILIGRFGTIEEVTSLVCWLASEECSFSTGAVFDVSGAGRSIELATASYPERITEAESRLPSPETSDGDASSTRPYPR